MSDTFCDATGEYINESGGSTIITNVSNDNLLAIPETSDANLLIKLVNNSATNTNNLYILQANPNGEIRFLTKDAYLNNDVDENDGNLYYNAKIGADGKLYCYWTYNFISNPVYFSGWKDIMSEVAISLRDISLIGAGLGVVEGQMATAIGDIITIAGVVSGHTGTLTTHTTQIGVIDVALADLTTIVVNMASMKSFTHQGWSGWKRRTNVKNAWSRMSDRYNFTPSTTSATGISTAGELFSLGGNTGAEVATIAGLTSRVASEGGSAMNIALGAGKKFLDGIGYALAGAGVIGGISAIAYTYDKQGAVNDEIALPFLYDVRAGIYNDSLKSAGDPTKKTLSAYLIHKNGLTIDGTTNNGFTTAGIYEYDGNASYPEMAINIIITAGLVAEIASVVNSGTKVWAVGNTIIIPKASIGGTSGNLTINVGTIYTASQVVDLHIAEIQARVEKRDKKMRRRSNVVNYDDIDTATFTNTTATEVYNDYWDTQETLTYKKLKSRLNLLPTGTSDVNVYTMGNIGVGTTGSVSTTKLDILGSSKFMGMMGIGASPPLVGDTFVPLLKIYSDLETTLYIRGANTTGSASIEFGLGDRSDTTPDFRLANLGGGDGLFLQYQNNSVVYNGAGSDLVCFKPALTNFYKDVDINGNCGIGVVASAGARLRVNGNIETTNGYINIGTGQKYKINNNDLSYNDLTNKLTPLIGGGITINGNNEIGATGFWNNVITGSGMFQVVEDNIYFSTAKVGIGANTTPTSLLHIRGNATHGGTLTIEYVGNTPSLELTRATGTASANYNWIVKNDNAFKIDSKNLATAYTTKFEISGVGDVGIGVATNTSYKLGVNGNINIPTGSMYKINGTDLSYNSLANKLTAGTNITINATTNEISASGGGTAYTGGNGITITGASIALSNTTNNDFTMYPTFETATLPPDLVFTGANVPTIFALPAPLNTLNKCYILPYVGTGTTASYSFTIPDGGYGGVIIDFLMIGGGGCGGKDMGAGGGAGAMMFGSSIFLTAGTYSASIGRGAKSSLNETTGRETTCFNSSGCAGGGSAPNVAYNGYSYSNRGGGGAGGTSVANGNNYSAVAGEGGLDSVFGGSYRGNLFIKATLYAGGGGGTGVSTRAGGGTGQICSAGGGGATSSGINGQTTTAIGTGTAPCNGGAGFSNDILGTSYRWAGGGGGGSTGYLNASTGGLGGGGGGQNANGAGATSFGAVGGTTYFTGGTGATALNGVNGTGGGGGGVGLGTTLAGDGGAGIVIIRYRLPKKAKRYIETAIGTTTALRNYRSGMVDGNYKLQSILASTGVATDVLQIEESSGDLLIGNVSGGISVAPNGVTYFKNTITSAGIDIRNGSINSDYNIELNGSYGYGNIRLTGLISNRIENKAVWTINALSAGGTWMIRLASMPSNWYLNIHNLVIWDVGNLSGLSSNYFGVWGFTSTFPYEGLLLSQTNKANNAQTIAVSYGIVSNVGYFVITGIPITTQVFWKLT